MFLSVIYLGRKLSLRRGQTGGMAFIFKVSYESNYIDLPGITAVCIASPWSQAQGIGEAIKVVLIRKNLVRYLSALPSAKKVLDLPGQNRIQTT